MPNFSIQSTPQSAATNASTQVTSTQTTTQSGKATASISGTPVTKTSLTGAVPYDSGMVGKLRDAISKKEFTGEHYSVLKSRAQAAFSSAHQPTPAPLGSKLPNLYAGKFEKLQQNPEMMRGIVPPPVDTTATRNIKEMMTSARFGEAGHHSPLAHISEHLQEVGKEKATHMLIEHGLHEAKKAGIRAIRSVLK